MNTEIKTVVFSDIEIGDYLINLGEVLEIEELKNSSTIVVSRFNQKYVFKLNTSESIYIIKKVMH